MRNASLRWRRATALLISALALVAFATGACESDPYYASSDDDSYDSYDSAPASEPDPCITLGGSSSDLTYRPHSPVSETIEDNLRSVYAASSGEIHDKIGAVLSAYDRLPDMSYPGMKRYARALRKVDLAIGDLDIACGYYP